MDIGGKDIVFEGTFNLSTAENIVEIFYILWPNAVVETETDNEDSVEFPIEWFIYKDQAAKDSWDEDGRSEENHDKMVYLIVSEHTVTFVLEGDEAEKFVKTWAGSLVAKR